jgi:hypothetical protein
LYNAALRPFAIDAPSARHQRRTTGGPQGTAGSPGALTLDEGGRPATLQEYAETCDGATDCDAIGVLVLAPDDGIESANGASDA